MQMSGFAKDLEVEDSFANVPDNQQEKRSPLPSHIEIDDDDMQEYYNHEGREMFGSAQGAMQFEQQLLEMLQRKLDENEQAGQSRGVVMVKDYDLDGDLEPEEINHQLTFVKRSAIVSQLGKNYAQEFPIATVETNYQ